MAEVKIMIVPGKIARVELLVSGMTVLDACEAARRQIAGVDWVALANDREVRVQNRKFSNTAEVVAGTFGSISTTPLHDGDVVLILTKIKGNAPAPGLGVLTVTIDGQEYALETPEQLGVVLANVAGYDITEIETMLVNGEESPFDQLVGAGDEVEIYFYGEDESEPIEEDLEEEKVNIDDLYANALAAEFPPDEPEYLLSVAEPEEAVAPMDKTSTAELDPDSLEYEADRLYDQAEAIRELAEAIRQVERTKARLAELGYKF